MLVPTAYTGPQLVAYLVTELSEVGTILGWDENTLQLHEAVYATARELGLTDVAAAPNLQQLLAIAKVRAWEQAVKALAARYDFADARLDAKRSQAFGMAQAVLAEAQLAAAEWISPYAVGVSSLRHVDDPYVYLPDDLRTI